MACIKPGINSAMLSWTACECSQHLAAALGMPRGQALHADIQLCGYVLQEAAKLYQRATSADPNNERTWLQLGLLERRRGQAAAARECFRRGVQAAPHNPYMYQAGTAAFAWDDKFRQCPVQHGHMPYFVCQAEPAGHTVQC